MSSWLTSLANKIGEIGENPDFVAFNAHWGFAYFVIHHYPVLAIPLALLAAFKEFWFDIRYETNQTYADGALDFIGYGVGIVLGVAG